MVRSQSRALASSSPGLRYSPTRRPPRAADVRSRRPCWAFGSSQRSLSDKVARRARTLFTSIHSCKEKRRSNSGNGSTIALASALGSYMSTRTLQARKGGLYKGAKLKAIHHKPLELVADDEGSISLGWVDV